MPDHRRSCRPPAACSGERAIVRFGAPDNLQYLFPIGTGDLRTAVDAVFSDSPTSQLVAVTEPELRELLAVYPDELEFFETRDCEDYLYAAESLATLSGKKLHGKRNHINAFSAAHEWSVSPLTPADFEACRRILAAWAQEHEGASVENERCAIERALNAFDVLELHGLLLIADGEAVGFTMGSMLTANTLCVHFEKALPEVNGAFPVIHREFVRWMLQRFPSLSFVNREDDMGLENLRRAKLSYRPLELIRKFTVTKKKDL